MPTDLARLAIFSASNLRRLPNTLKWKVNVCVHGSKCLRAWQYWCRQRRRDQRSIRRQPASGLSAKPAIAARFGGQAAGCGVGQPADSHPDRCLPDECDPEQRPALRRCPHPSVAEAAVISTLHTRGAGPLLTARRHGRRPVRLHGFLQFLGWAERNLLARGDLHGCARRRVSGGASRPVSHL
jgi:hypothetical protein